MLYLLQKGNGVCSFFELSEDIESAYEKVNPVEVKAQLFKKATGGYVLTRVDDMGVNHIYEITEISELTDPTKKEGLNMDHLRMTETLAKEQRIFCIADLSAAVAHVAINLSDGYLPRFFDAVMVTFTDDMLRQEGVFTVGDVAMIESTLDDVVALCHKLLMTNPSFREWNLTALEAVNHINVDDDEQRAEAGLFEKSDKKFIDLDAFRQNLYCVLRSKLVEDWFFESH